MVNLLFEKQDANNLEWINTKEDVKNKTCLIKNVSTDFYSPVDNVFSPYQTLKDGGQDVKFLYLDDVEDPMRLLIKDMQYKNSIQRINLCRFKVFLCLTLHQNKIWVSHKSRFLQKKL